MMKEVLVGAGVLASLATLNANDKALQNPWELVYQAALIQNQKRAVNIQPVSYNANGVKAAANIYSKF